MPTFSNTIQALKRYRTLSRKLLADINQRRTHWLKKKQRSVKKTAAEKEEAKVKRDAKREAYEQALGRAAKLLKDKAVKLWEQFGGHTLQYYKESILQVGRLKVEARGVSRWNAYLHHQAKLANESCGENETTRRVHELAAALKEQWNGMSPEEKIALTDPLLEELKEIRANTTYGRRNVLIESFNDATQSLLTMERY
ncbi:hypothetical protein C0992_000119, partial [Termitomyces sp. T32_za158]